VVIRGTLALAQGAKDQTTHVRLEKVARPAARYPHCREEINYLGTLGRLHFKHINVVIPVSVIQAPQEEISAYTSVFFRREVSSLPSARRIVLWICTGTKKQPND